jgi:hypothetical protein
VAKSLDASRTSARGLVIDTRSNDRFPFDLNRFVQSEYVLTENSAFPTSAIIAAQASTYPGGVKGKVEPKTYITQEVNGALVEEDSMETLTWPRKLRGVSASLIIHEQWGGGMQSLKALAYLQPTKELTEKIRPWLMDEYTQGFLGIHFRNTDYRSSLGSLKTEATRNPGGSLIFTDDINLMVSQLPDRARLATATISDDPAELFVGALGDLLALSKCQSIALIPLSGANVKYSGFGLLASSVWAARANSKYELLKRIISIGKFHVTYNFSSVGGFLIVVIPGIIACYRAVLKGSGIVGMSETVI